MPAAHTGAAAAADGIDLVDKDDGRRHFLRLVKQIADTACADADVELDKVRAGDGEKLHVRFSGHRLGDEGFARPRRADQQDALGDPGAHGSVFFRGPEEIDDLG